MASPERKPRSSRHQDVAPGDSANLIREIRNLEGRLTELKRDLLQRPTSGLVPSAGDSTHFVLLRVGEDVLALPVGYLREMVPMAALSPLPDAVSTVAGLLNYHGEKLAVINLGELLGAPIDPLSTEKSLAVCSLEGFGFALLVDEATDVVDVQRDQIRIAEQVMPGAVRAVGIFDTDGATALIADIWSVVLAVQLQVERGDRRADDSDDTESLEEKR